MPEKYQREIEDILGQDGDTSANSAGPRKPSLLRVFRTGVSNLPRGYRWRTPSGRLMLAGLVFLLIALLFRSSMPTLVAPLAWVAVILFILGYSLFFINPSSSSEKRWRGRVVETTPSWWEQFRRRIRGP